MGPTVSRIGSNGFRSASAGAVDGAKVGRAIGAPPRPLSQQTADLLRQPPSADVLTWAVAAGWDAPAARVCCDTRGEEPAWGRSFDSPAARSPSRTPPTPFWTTTTSLGPPAGSTEPRLPAWSLATDLDPALALLEEHGWLRRVDADSRGPKGGRPPSPRFLVNPCTPRQNLQTYKTSLAGRFCRFCGAWRHLGRPAVSARSVVTLSNENRPSRSRPCQESCLAASGAQRPADAPRRPGPPNAVRQSASGGP